MTRQGKYKSNKIHVFLGFCLCSLIVKVFLYFNVENIKGDKSIGNLLLIIKSGPGFMGSLDYSLIRCKASNIILMKLHYVYDKHSYGHHVLF